MCNISKQLIATPTQATCACHFIPFDKVGYASFKTLPLLVCFNSFRLCQAVHWWMGTSSKLCIPTQATCACHFIPFDKVGYASFKTLPLLVWFNSFRLCQAVHWWMGRHPNFALRKIHGCCQNVAFNYKSKRVYCLIGLS